MPIFLQALGTVQAAFTVSVRSQIDGKVVTVNFVEGQEVKKGATLAEIDSRALAALDQATAKKAQDAAQLAPRRRIWRVSRSLAARPSKPSRTSTSTTAPAIP